MRVPRSRARGAVTALVLVLVLPPLAAAEEPAPFQVRVEPLAPDLHLLVGAGCNVLACAGPTGVLLVDADYEPTSAGLLAAIEALAAGPVRLVVDTHWHFDHVGGHAALAATGALIAAHPSNRGYMAAGGRLEVIGQDVPPADPATLPCLEIPDSLTLRWGDETMRILHLGSGHTGGDLVVRFARADVLHVGDLFFNFGYPYIDTAHGGGIDQLLATLGRVLDLCGPATRIVPGHGPVGTPQELASYREMLREFRDLVAAEMAQGRDLAEILDGRPTVALDEKYGQTMFPPAAFTEMVWLSLGGRPPAAGPSR